MNDDDRRAAYFEPLEIMTAKERILTRADALVMFLRRQPFEPRDSERLDGFFTHESTVNPAADIGSGTTTHMILEKLDPDTNRLFLELLRSAWELRCWQVYYGFRERPDQ